MSRDERGSREVVAINLIRNFDLSADSMGGRDFPQTLNRASSPATANLLHFP